MISVLAQRHAELAELCKRFGVERLEVFGSAASEEGFDPQQSDVDFIVDFGPNRDLGPWLEKYFSFREALSSLFGYPAGLVMASAMKNPYFIREANGTRKLLYAA